MAEKLEACPFCGGEAERFTIGEDDPVNVGGDVIACKKCGASSHVEFGFKENLVSRWNTRATPDRSDDALAEENRRLTDALLDLCSSAGGLNIVTDGEVRFRNERENVLRALKGARAALKGDGL